MMRRNTFVSAGVLAAATLLGACSDEAGTRSSPMEPVFAATTTTPPGAVAYVCKDGPAGEYTFEASATGGDLQRAGFTLTPTGVPEESCKLVWSSVQGMDPASLTVAENVPADMEVTSIVIVRTDGSLVPEPEPWETVVGASSVTVEGLDFENGAIIWFFNAEIPDEPEEPGDGAEGCTPGYWKQKHHFGNWTGYSPDQQFSSVFENAFPGKTLLQVVSQGGGGLKALGRHTVAALLNGSGDVDYAMSAQQVIDAFNTAHPGGDYEGLKDVFEGYNERGCPLGRAE